MSLQIEILIIGMMAAVACSLLGVFLVLKKMSMMSDAITHTILLGIVLVFFITKDLNSPWLIAGASLMGVLSVYLIESLQRTKLLSEEASIGVVFPFIFSIAILLITYYAGSVHLDTDSVLLGELSFAPFDRATYFGISLPRSLVSMAIILSINVVFIKVFFKELKLSSFDPLLSAILGFSPVLIHYGLMTLISITAVGAFNVVGSILVISFMIGPPITASLLTHDLKKLIAYSSTIAMFNAFFGFLLAFGLDVSISGSMAVITGLTFMLVFLFAPKEGYISLINLRQKQKIEFEKIMILFHLFNHENDKDYDEECGVDTLYHHLNWKKELVSKHVQSLEENNLIAINGEIIHLTEKGRQESSNYYQSIFEK